MKAYVGYGCDQFGIVNRFEWSTSKDAQWGIGITVVEAHADYNVVEGRSVYVTYGDYTGFSKQLHGSRDHAHNCASCGFWDKVGVAYYRRPNR